MFNPLNTNDMDDYVQRLNARLRKMPTQERDEVNQEVRQHLEALVTAHIELGATPHEAVMAALSQFGDPDSVGRRLVREWRWGVQWPIHGNAFAFTYAYISFTGALAILAAVACLWGTVATVGSLWLTQWTPFENTFILSVGSLAPAAAGWLTGRRTGRRAVPAMVGAIFAAAAPLWLLGVLTTVFGHGQWEGMRGMSLMTSCWLLLGSLSAYASSARTLGGCYRLRLFDPKLRLR